MGRNATIIPVGSGKGGVGKTMLTANLAVALAEAGHSVIAIDLDLGGSNLHSYLGVPNRFAGVGDFVKTRGTHLHDLSVPAGVENLSLILGDGSNLFMANLLHAQKTRLIRRIEQLQADYVLLDLGAGTTFNTLDFFALSDHGLLVTQPELPAAMNMLGFLKQFLLRRVSRRFSGDTKVKECLRQLEHKPVAEGEPFIRALRRSLSRVNKDARQFINDTCRQYRPRVVFNMGYSPDEMALTKRIDRVARRCLNLELDYFGYIFHDAAVHQSVIERRVFLPGNRDSISGQEIRRTADRIRRFWDRAVGNSAARILSNAQRSYDEQQRATEKRPVVEER